MVNLCNRILAGVVNKSLKVISAAVLRGKQKRFRGNHYFSDNTIKHYTGK